MEINFTVAMWHSKSLAWMWPKSVMKLIRYFHQSNVYIYSTYHNCLCSLYMLVRNFRMTGISMHHYIDIFGSKRHLLTLQMQSLAPALASLKTCFQTSDEQELDQCTVKISQEMTLAWSSLHADYSARRLGLVMWKDFRFIMQHQII